MQDLILVGRACSTPWVRPGFVRLADGAVGGSTSLPEVIEGLFSGDPSASEAELRWKFRRPGSRALRTTYLVSAARAESESSGSSTALPDNVARFGVLPRLLEIRASQG